MSDYGKHSLASSPISPPLPAAVRTSDHIALLLRYAKDDTEGKQQNDEIFLLEADMHNVSTHCAPSLTHSGRSPYLVEADSAVP